MTAMIQYLREDGYKVVYSRHLVGNDAVSGLNHSLGFLADGEPYTDENGLEWQNIILSLHSDASRAKVYI